jgi:hypothetical protein|tara:strand:- start:311 stop:514 length:204 start_codon:yes stop_codon:yes gene_type:complete
MIHLQVTAQLPKFLFRSPSAAAAASLVRLMLVRELVELTPQPRHRIFRTRSVFLRTLQIGALKIIII